MNANRNNSKTPKLLLKTKDFYVVIFRRDKKISEVAEHFNLKGHCKDLYLWYCIFENNLLEKEIFKEKKSPNCF